MLSEKEVAHIAKLANLPLSREELLTFSSQLAEVLNYIEVLNEVNTDEITPTFQVTGVKNVMRDDKSPQIEKTLKVENALRNASATDGKYFVVPSVFDEGR